jgi:hypothetical protein
MRRGRRVVLVTRRLLVGDVHLERGDAIDCIAQTWRQIRCIGAGTLL